MLAALVILGIVLVVAGWTPRQGFRRPVRAVADLEGWLGAA